MKKLDESMADALDRLKMDSRVNWLLDGITKPFRKGRLRISGRLRGGLWPGVPDMPIYKVDGRLLLLGNGFDGNLLRIAEWPDNCLGFACSSLRVTKDWEELVDYFQIPKDEFGWETLAKCPGLPDSVVRFLRGEISPLDKKGLGRELAKVVCPWAIDQWGPNEVGRFLKIRSPMQFTVYHMFVPSPILDAMLAMAKAGWTPMVPNWAGRMGWVFNREWGAPCDGTAADLRWSPRVYLELHEKKLCQFPVGAFGFHAPGPASYWWDLPKEWVKAFCDTCYQTAYMKAGGDIGAQLPWLHNAATNVPLLTRDDEGLKMFKIGVTQVGEMKKVTATEVPFGGRAVPEVPDDPDEDPAPEDRPTPMWGPEGDPLTGQWGVRGVRWR